MIMGENEENRDSKNSKKEFCIFEQTAKCLKEKEIFLTTGCGKLDTFLKGGIAKHGITQIYGGAGCGKTQLALQLCLTSQIPSAQTKEINGALYICTESAFPTKRLQELLEKSSCIAKHHSVSDKLIHISHISSVEDLELCILKHIPLMLKSHKISLIVIDSIAAPYRAESETINLKNRAKSLRSIGYKLHDFSRNYQIAVVCINQVTAMIGNNIVEHISTQEQPALGIQWANLVTNSLYMCKKHSSRYLTISGSPYLPCQSIRFEILDSGVFAKEA